MMSRTDSVGVRAVKARLSEFLARARAGERITVTDRGRPIAVIGPVNHPAPPNWVLEMLAEGHATWSGGKPQGLHPRLPARGRLASAMVLEDRR
jgi:prevent-host-death family protein